MAARFRLLVSVAVLACLAACGDPAPPRETAAPVLPAPAAAVFESLHYSVQSTADERSTVDAAAAAEALYEAYSDFFGGLPARDGMARLRLRLYADREEFQANNRSRPWAEGYYHQGVCHAYLDASKPNPHHWLLHEAVHQLNREVTGYAKEKWLNEGIATYFGSSRYANGRLETGMPDLDTYPLWWLRRWKLSGDFASDVQARSVIPLRALITGQGGPPLDATVNAHYLGYWSLTHFLLHHDGGRHADGYRQLVRHGGTLADFEEHIGPVAQVEREWYRYLLGMVAAPRTRPADEGTQ